MKLQISRDALRLGLESVQGAVPSRTTLTVLTNVHLVAEGGQLRFHATDLDTWVSLAVACEVESEGELCVPAKRMLEIAKAVPAAPIALASDNTSMRVKAGSSNYRINGLAADEFPAAPGGEYGEAHTILAGDLWRLLDAVGGAVSTEETRPILNGALWTIGEDEMAMVGTNGHRLSKLTIPSSGGPETREAIVRPAALKLSRALFDDAQEVGVSFSDTHVRLRADGSELIARMIEGPYPNYEQVIPKDNDKVAVVRRETLVAALRRVAIVASDQTHRIRVSLSEDGIGISAHTPDEGEADDRVAAEYRGTPLEIGFNVLYLLELIGKMPTDSIRMTFKAPERAATIHPVGDDAPELFSMVMPLRLFD